MRHTNYNVTSNSYFAVTHSLPSSSRTAGCGKSTLLSVLTDSIQSNIRGTADGKNESVDRSLLSVLGVDIRQESNRIKSHFLISFDSITYPLFFNYTILMVVAVLLPGANAFVPQDDRLHGFFTVKSYMHHYSRLAGLKPTPELDQEIDDLISDLGLWEQQGTIVGDLFLKGLSGGQKRRLSIGLEALTQPAVSFLLVYYWIRLDSIRFDLIGCVCFHFL